MTTAIILALLVLSYTANCVDLPPTITAGTSSYPDYSVPVGGATLDVATMLANTPPGGPTFEAPRLAFDGTLTISLPTTAAAWPGGVPLTVTIVDGKSTASQPSPHLKVSGVLAAGSKISLLGGVYEYSTRFIIVPAAGLTIQDVSSLLIEGGTYRELCPAGGGFTFFLLISGNLTLNSGSTL